MSKFRTRALLICVVLGVILVSSPDANATPLTYLQSLNNRGIIIYDTVAALNTGFSICEALNYANGDEVATELFLRTSWADVPDMYTAYVVVVTAVEELCPWHDHRYAAQSFLS